MLLPPTISQVMAPKPNHIYVPVRCQSQMCDTIARLVGSGATSPTGSTGQQRTDQVQNNPLVQGYHILTDKNRIHETSI